jgi:hypothetical protein
MPQQKPKQAPKSSRSRAVVFTDKLIEMTRNEYWDKRNGRGSDTLLLLG